MEKKKILLIDDEPLLVKSTLMALSIYGFEARGALDGEQGLKAVEEMKPDIILLDIMMPGMDGWDVLQRLKANETTKTIPVLLFTAREYADGQNMAAAAGANDLITKPFEPQDLADIITKNLS